MILVGLSFAGAVLWFFFLRYQSQHWRHDESGAPLWDSEEVVKHGHNEKFWVIGMSVFMFVFLLIVGSRIEAEIEQRQLRAVIREQARAVRDQDSRDRALRVSSYQVCRVRTRATLSTLDLARISRTALHLSNDRTAKDLANTARAIASLQVIDNCERRYPEVQHEPLTAVEEYRRDRKRALEDAPPR